MQSSTPAPQNGLSEKASKEIFKQRRKRFPRRRVRCSKPHIQWEVDLGFFEKNSPILFGIDCFSKKGFAVPVQNKKGLTIVAGFKHAVVKYMDNIYPIFIFSDSGTEFLNRDFRGFLKSNLTTHFSSNDKNIKASLCERFIRTIKTMLARMLYTNSSRDWRKFLHPTIENYNNQHHSAIKMAPNMVNARNIDQVRKNLFGPDSRYFRKHKPKQKNDLKIGDFVRIANVITTFSKESHGNFSEEIFKVSKIDKSEYPTIYKLHDITEKKEALNGIFYRAELVKTQLNRSE